MCTSGYGYFIILIRTSFWLGQAKLQYGQISVGQISEDQITVGQITDRPFYMFTDEIFALK